jgi:murein DD-endopeptidase MepM/ murein hydrolase activator NlpD
MANKMVANIKSLTTETRGLTKEVESLYKSIEKLNAIAGKAFKNVSGAINTSGGSMGLGQGTTRPGVGTDNARFTQPPTPTGMSSAGGTTQVSKSRTEFAQAGPADPTIDKMKMLGGAAKILMAAPAGAYAATPDVGLTMGRALGYYQAGLTSPGISRNQLQRATFSAMGGGLSSVGSDAIVAAGLAGRGYTVGSANYQQAAAQVGGAYKYLGMENAVATQAIAGFQSGPMGANLYQYGINTRTASGKEKTPGQIAKELMGVMGGGKATTQQVRESFQRGALGANLKTMGFDPAQQEILYQAMIDLSAGRNPDLAARGSAQGTDKNSNTMLTAQGRMNASQTSLMTKGEESMIKGFENAADTVEAFNRALENVIQPLSQLKGLVGGVGATNVGAGIAVSASMFASGVGDIVSAIKTIVTRGAGGGRSGFGGGFGKGGSTGSSPVSGAGVTAAYGAQGDMWSGTNGTHKGTDYAVPIGTPVTAWSDGVVSKEVLDSGYGTAVMIEHPNGMQSIYGHLSAKDVQPGQTIKAGQRLGKSGDTGNASGPHLHFELRKGKNNPVDPSGYTNAKSLLGGQYISAVVMPSTSELLSTGAASNSVGTTMDMAAPTGKGALSNSELLSVLSGAGFTGSSLATAFKVARAESGGRPGALNPNAKTGDYSLGLFQVNMIGDLGKARNAKYLKEYAGIGYKGPESLYDPSVNARIAYDISKGGTKWTDAWVNTSKKLGISGGGDVGYGASMPTQLQSGNKTVNVTIKFDQATDQDAIRFAKKVKDYLDHDTEISMIGGS